MKQHIQIKVNIYDIEYFMGFTCRNYLFLWFLHGLKFIITEKPFGNLSKCVTAIFTGAYFAKRLLQLIRTREIMSVKDNDHI